MKIENVFLDLSFQNKNEIIEDIIKKFTRRGVAKEYCDSIWEREKTCSFSIGNNIAIPHGTYEGMAFLKESNLLLYILKEPVDWDGDKVHVVIGLATTGDEHMNVLQNIAINSMNEDFFSDFITNPTPEKIKRFLE